MFTGTGITSPAEREIALEDFPAYDELFRSIKQWKGIEGPRAAALSVQPYFTDGNWQGAILLHQKVAINRAIRKRSPSGENRLLLVMATGTGKTYTAFQIIWRLWKAKRKKRILFLADRNILVDQTILQDFAPFGEVMHKITNREIKKNYEIYLALYQGVTGKEDWKQVYRQFPPDFFDLVVIDEEMPSGSAAVIQPGEVLDYFAAAIKHIGLTATPKEKKKERGEDVIRDPEYNYN